MGTFFRLVLAFALVGGPLVLKAADGHKQTDDRETFFETRIRPVLATKCFRCHGASKANNGFRLDRREALIRGGDSGPALVAGRPDQSLLIRAIRQVDDLKMPPPPDSRLPDVVIADFERWIRDGAAWPKRDDSSWKPADGAPAGQSRWAFRPVVKGDPPNDPSGWSANAVDRFIAQGHRLQGLKPVARRPNALSCGAPTSICSACPRLPKRCGPSWRTSLPPHLKKSRTGYSLRPNTANVGAATGWTSPATPIRRATMPIIPSPKPACIATISLIHSMPTSRMTNSCASRSRATCWRNGAIRSATPSR